MLCKVLTKAQEQCVHTHGIDVKKAMCDHVGSKYHRLKESTGHTQLYCQHLLCNIKKEYELLIHKSFNKTDQLVKHKLVLNAAIPQLEIILAEVQEQDRTSNTYCRPVNVSLPSIPSRTSLSVPRPPCPYLSHSFS